MVYDFLDLGFALGLMGVRFFLTEGEGVAIFELMTSDELKERTMGFALRVVKMVEALPDSEAGRTVARQIIRCATSVAANYRAALRAKSDADFINKVTIVLEEADEVGFWLEFSARAQLLSVSRLQGLMDEADELTRIFNATRTATRKRVSKSKRGHE